MCPHLKGVGGPISQARHPILVGVGHILPVPCILSILPIIDSVVRIVPA